MGLLEGSVDKPLWMWFGFVGVVLLLLLLDLGLVHRRQREMGLRASLNLAGVYILLGLAFGGWVWWYFGKTAALDYLTGFVIEKSLAIDNVFVIAMIFAYLKVPLVYQHRVLFFGILGAIVLRAIMIGFGAAMVHRFEWLLYVFGVFLILTGARMWLAGEEVYDVAHQPAMWFLRRHFRISDAICGKAFFVRIPDPKTGKMVRHATPLFAALVLVETADVIFAVDSVPAILAITTDPFIVYTSNIFAILGLRALYFVLAATVERFRYLKYALALLLIFIGSKIFVAEALGLEKFPPWLSLFVTLAILASGIGFSLWRTRG